MTIQDDDPKLDVLLEKVVTGRLSETERAELIERVTSIEQDPGVPISDRVAATLLHAALAARGVHAR